MGGEGGLGGTARRTDVGGAGGPRANPGEDMTEDRHAEHHLVGHTSGSVTARHFLYHT
jgi:hypothetical protein